MSQTKEEQLQKYTFFGAGDSHFNYSYFCKTRPDWSFEDKFEVIAAIIIRYE